MKPANVGGQPGVQNHTSGQSDAAGPGLPKGTGRQQPAVANAAVVKHHDLNVALHGEMLQTVIGDHHIGSRIGVEQQADGVATAARDKNRHIGDAFDERWFVARQVSPHCVSYFNRLIGVAAVAARHHANSQALNLHVPHQCDHQRRFSSATGHDIAHHHHWNRKALRFE